MEFKGLNCPVCEKPFEDGDDIVVCPDCGTPHHRACWEIENHCAFEDKHGEEFDYKEQEGSQSDVTICPKCNTENIKDAFYCSKCGAPLNMQNTQTNYQYQNQGGANPFATAFDPMAGINPDEDMGGVTAGDLAKYVGTNTQYFMRVFSRIKTFGRSKFSFVGFLLTGFYLLYRKMYKLGAIIAAAMILLLIAETYIEYTPAYAALTKAVTAQSAAGATGYFSSYTNITNAFFSLDFQNQIMVFIMMLCSSLRLGIQIIVGIFANRWYFKHCRTQVKTIKEKEDNPNKVIEEKGGVNLAPAISLGVIYAAVYIIPSFIFGNGLF